ncbi:MAG: DMT family transporter [Paenalcaligenes sp.]
MSFFNPAWSAHAAMGLFVLLWGSAALFTRWGLDYASPTVLLLLRFSLAMGALLLLGLRRPIWPAKGTRWQVASTGLLLVGGYSICYFQSMAHGITPGLLATLLGTQPVLTLLLTERRFSIWRLSGLLLSMAGLALVVWQGASVVNISTLGLLYGLGALACITFGSLRQKRIQQAPDAVLPLQYVMTLLLCVIVLPFETQTLNLDWGLVIPLLWLGLVISVAAQLLLYRMIRSGNLVNITSLFYLVPVVTVIMDYVFLGNALPALALVGMVAILAGLALVFRKA